MILAKIILSSFFIITLFYLFSKYFIQRNVSWRNSVLSTLLAFTGYEMFADKHIINYTNESIKSSLFLYSDSNDTRSISSSFVTYVNRFKTYCRIVELSCLARRERRSPLWRFAGATRILDDVSHLSIYSSSKVIVIKFVAVFEFEHV